jgi:hypothetical protein
MTENDLFNRDAMFWRDINYTAPSAIAEIELLVPFDDDGGQSHKVTGKLLPFETGVIEYEMDNGGSFTKNEVIAWPFVLNADLDFYLDEANDRVERDLRVKSILHSNVKSITLKDDSNQTIVRKVKL